jgi:hypothetical protein
MSAPPQAVRVCCRVRPALPSESTRCCTEITSFNGMRMIQLNDPRNTRESITYQFDEYVPPLPPTRRSGCCDACLRFGPALRTSASREGQHSERHVWEGCQRAKGGLPPVWRLSHRRANNRAPVMSQPGPAARLFCFPSRGSGRRCAHDMRRFDHDWCCAQGLHGSIDTGGCVPA